MKRFIMYSDLKPEKVQDYVELHANPWPELLELLTQCHIHNYSISLRGAQVYTYYEYTGDNYDKKQRRCSYHSTPRPRHDRERQSHRNRLQVRKISPQA